MFMFNMDGSDETTEQMRGYVRGIMVGDCRQRCRWCDKEIKMELEWGKCCMTRAMVMVHHSRERTVREGQGRGRYELSVDVNIMRGSDLIKLYLI